MNKVFAIILVFSCVVGVSYAQTPYYLKGEFGYSGVHNTTMKNDSSTSSVNDDQLYTGDELSNIKHGKVYGIGVGYKLNDYVRTDIMANIRDGYKIDSTKSGDFYGGAQKFSGDIQSKTAMATIYAQKEYSIFSPYIGAGVGYGENKINSYSYENDGLKGYGPGKTNYDFAWQLTGGLGIKTSDHIVLDFSYRYVDLGKISAGKGINNLDQFGLGSTNLEGINGNLKVQEALIGLRYEF